MSNGLNSGHARFRSGARGALETGREPGFGLETSGQVLDRLDEASKVIAGSAGDRFWTGTLRRHTAD